MICDKCGYKNNDGIKNCSNCGAIISAPPGDEELSEMIDRLAGKITDIEDILEPTVEDKIMKWVLFLFAPISIVIGIIFEQSIAVGVIIAIVSIVGGVSAGYPIFIWSLFEQRLSMTINSSYMSPTGYWSIMRKVSYWIILGIVVYYNLTMLLGEF